MSVKSFEQRELDPAWTFTCHLLARCDVVIRHLASFCTKELSELKASSHTRYCLVSEERRVSRFYLSSLQPKLLASEGALQLNWGK